LSDRPAAAAEGEEEAGEAACAKSALHAHIAVTGACWRIGRLLRAQGAFHTAGMTLKNAALLALIGTLLLTILSAANFVHVVLGVVRGLIPAMALLGSLIHLLAYLSVTVFFYVFGRAQSQ
jgi:hypothetical protein